MKNILKSLFLVVVLFATTIAAPGRAQTNAIETFSLGPVNVSGSSIVINGIPGVNSVTDIYGVPIRFIPGASPNPGGLSANINGLGLIVVKKMSRLGLVPLTGGEIQGLQIVEIVNDSQEYVCTTCVNTYKLPTYQYLTSGSAATYTTPAGATSLEIWMCGGGGGAGNASSNGTAGTASVFGSTTANGGSPSTASSTTPGAGGTGGTTGTGTQIERMNGVQGGNGTNVGAAGSGTITYVGGSGGVSPRGGASMPLVGGSTNALANSCSGGSGSPITMSGGSGTFNPNAGAGSGEWVSFFINAPTTPYTYTVGPGGNAGGGNSGAGGSGVIRVKELYN